MRQCPFCAEMIHDSEKTCPYCKSSLVKLCPYCGEQISAAAKKCKHCKTLLPEIIEEKEEAPPSFYSRLYSRDLLTIFLLSLLTCGIYLYFLIYRIGRNIKDHNPQAEINPGREIVPLCLLYALFLILTLHYIFNPDSSLFQWICMLMVCAMLEGFFLWMVVRYAREIYEMNCLDKIDAEDKTLLCAILDILQLGFISLLIIQNELNKHWIAHDTKGRVSSTG
jgi:hypothetical protein